MGNNNVAGTKNTTQRMLKTRVGILAKAIRRPKGKKKDDHNERINLKQSAYENSCSSPTFKF